MSSVISLMAIIIIMYNLIFALINSINIESVPGIFLYTVALLAMSLLSIGIVRKIKSDENE